MSADAWVVMVGFRIFDVGLLVLWLVWFFRLREDDGDLHDDGEDDHGGGPPLKPPGPSGGGLGRIMPGALPTGRRLRDHARADRRRSGRRPLPQPSPDRVRRPHRRPVPVR